MFLLSYVVFKWIWIFGMSPQLEASNLDLHFIAPV